MLMNFTYHSPAVGSGMLSVPSALVRAERAAISPPAAVLPPKSTNWFATGLPLTFARIHHYLAMATPLLWTRQRDTIGVLGLALNTCAERDGFVEERARIAELIAGAQELWATLPDLEDEQKRLEANRYTFRLVHLADILAVTTSSE